MDHQRRDGLEHKVERELVLQSQSYQHPAHDASIGSFDGEHNSKYEKDDRV